MKRMIWGLLLVTLAFSCNEKEDPSLIEGRVKFNFSNSQDNDNGRRKVVFEPFAVVLTVEDTDGNKVYNHEVFNLISFGGSWITEEHTFPVGNYRLTEFIVLNESQVAIAATPVENSAFAHLVSDPLPVDFAVEQDASNQITIEVVGIQEEDTPESFGYVSISLKPVLVKHLDIQTTIASSSFDVTSQVGYALEVTVKDDDGNSVWEYTWSDLANVDQIVIPSGHHQYNFVTSKEGHIQHAQYYLGSQLEHIAQLRFELIPEQSTEILTFSNLDGLGINYYLSVDPCLLYARVDFPESFVDEIGETGQYIMVDRAVVTDAGSPVITPSMVETFSGNEGFATQSTNLWPDYASFSSLADQSYCGTIPDTDEPLNFQTVLIISTTSTIVGHFHEW